MCKNWAERGSSPGHQQWVLTLLKFLSPMSIQLRLTVLSWNIQSVLGKREWFALHFQRTASVLFACAVMASAVKLVGNFIPLFPWRSCAFWVTMTIPKHVVLFWNTTVHISHTLQGFNNGKNLLKHSLFPSISPENTKLWLFQRTKAKIFQRKVSLILSPRFFSLLPSIPPPFLFVETKEKTL